MVWPDFLVGERTPRPPKNRKLHLKKTNQKHRQTDARLPACRYIALTCGPRGWRKQTNTQTDAAVSIHTHTPNTHTHNNRKLHLRQKKHKPKHRLAHAYLWPERVAGTNPGVGSRDQTLTVRSLEPVTRNFPQGDHPREVMLSACAP